MYLPAVQEVFPSWKKEHTRLSYFVYNLKRSNSHFNPSTLYIFAFSYCQEKQWFLEQLQSILSCMSRLLQDTINNVKSRLGKSVQIQTVLRAFEARDRNIQESNFDMVNLWSVVNVIVMMLVSAVQVYLVRSLFEDKRKIRT